MSTIYGAGIVCQACGARPWGDPDDPGVRSSFDLLRVSGVWCCERHRPDPAAKEERAPRASPLVEAMSKFEAAITAQGATLADAIDGLGALKAALLGGGP